MPSSSHHDPPSPAPAPRTGRWRLAVLALVVAWAAWNLGAELLAVAREVQRPPNPGAVAEWRLATPRAQGLGNFLHFVDGQLPPDRHVAFTARSGNPDQEFFLTLWAAYHLPRQRVIRLRPDLDLERVDYVVTYNSELDDPRLREVARDFSGVVYRVEPAGAPEAAVGATPAQVRSRGASGAAPPAEGAPP